jgi:4-carboxymuconolactone decarboxylase
VIRGWRLLVRCRRPGSRLPYSSLSDLWSQRRRSAPELEWYAHARLAREAGIADTVIEAIRRGEQPSLQHEKPRAVYAVSRELHATCALSDPTYATAEAALGREALVDLVGILGYYTLVSMPLNTFRVPTPDGTEPFADL